MDDLQDLLSANLSVMDIDRLHQHHCQCTQTVMDKQTHKKEFPDVCSIYLCSPPYLISPDVGSSVRLMPVACMTHMHLITMKKDKLYTDHHRMASVESLKTVLVVYRDDNLKSLFELL